MSCQDIIELCEIRDGLASCDTLSNDICKIIDIICISLACRASRYYLLYYSVVFIESMLCIVHVCIVCILYYLTLCVQCIVLLIQIRVKKDIVIYIIYIII